MDRKIPNEVLRKERNIKLIKFGAVILVFVVVIAIIISLLRESINLRNIQLSTVDTGTIEVSVSASGKVAPAFEEIINTPIESRIVEVYKKAGDSVDVGTPLLRLDLQSIETDYRKMLDELQMRQYRIEQQRIKNNSTISNTEMQLKVNDMQIDKMQVEVRNEKYLDSIGAGTTDKVREVELSYNVAKLEQEQSRKKFENDKQVADSELRVQELELEIFRKTMAETKRILEDAQIRSPRKAILTYINSQVGARVAQGTQVAILSDLSHFRIDGEIADSYGDRISTGNKVVV
ncbi:HlyD family secretion protein, partial [Proteiniphilum sp. UBA5510]